METRQNKDMMINKGKQKQNKGKTMGEKGGGQKQGEGRQQQKDKQGMPRKQCQEID